MRVSWESARLVASRTSGVPSSRQKLSVSSSKERLQVGQRFTISFGSNLYRDVSPAELLYALHEDSHAIQQDEKRDTQEVNRARDNPGDGEGLASEFVRIVLDLDQ